MSPSSRLITLALRLLLAAACLVVLPSTGLAQVASVSGDATVSQANPSLNTGTLPNLTVGGGNASLIRFDLSTLPAGVAGSDIQKATMIYINRVLIAGAVDFAEAGQAWAENTVTFNTFNLVLPAFAASVPTSGAGFLTVDVTSQVQNWVNSPSQNYGVVIEAAAAAPTTSVVVDSKENTATSHPAFLNIVLASSGGATGATGPSGPSGPAGPAGGPQGPSGPAGPAGIAGPSGPSGPAGAAGVQGPSGPAGPAGAQGPSGPAGAAGAQGPSGPAGPAGVAGPTGATGVAGAQGAQGATGPAGPAGIAGPTGATGVAGAQGAQGATGPAGPAGIAGPTGATGVAGAQGANGAGVFGAAVVNPNNLTPFYLSLNGDSPQTTNSPQFTGISMPVACTFDRLSVSLYSASGGSANTISVTLVKNGVDTSLSCTASSSITAGAIVTCQDTVGPVAVAIGDIVGLHVTQTNNLPVVRISIGTRCN